MASAVWSPDGQSVLLVADFQLRVSVWNLAQRTCTYLAGPKHARSGITFDASGAMCAVLERHGGRDAISVYECRGWQRVGHWPLDTADAADCAWCPAAGSSNSHLLAVWDSCLSHTLCVQAAPHGQLIARYSAAPSASCHALGLKAAAWSPAGDLLALGSFDQVARLLPAAAGFTQPLLECEHPATLAPPAHSNVVVYQEVEEMVSAAAGSGGISSSPGGSAAQKVLELRSRYTIAGLPAAVPSREPPLDRPNPRRGVGRLAWSPSGAFLATLNENQPTAVWIWDLGSLELAAVLLHVLPVTDMQWAPRQGGSMLGIATASGQVYLWSPQVCPLPPCACLRTCLPL